MSGDTFPPSLLERFWSKVDQSGECWVWTAARMPHGYGVFGTKSIKPPQQQYAHRMAWQIARGPIPAGLHVLHHCDNPPCVRPDHLFLGTQAENTRDMDRKGRRRCHSKIDEQAVLAIRARYAAGGVTQVALAHEYGIDFRHVSQIVHRKRWSSVA